MKRSASSYPTCLLPIVGMVLLGMAGSASATESPDAINVWFGTYTRGGAGSDGIYASRFDPRTGTLEPPVLAARVANPSFLAAHPTMPRMYGVGDVADGNGKPVGSVLAYACDTKSGHLRAMTTRASGGSGPCHVCVDPAGKVVLAANYGGGSVICLGIADDGSLAPVASGGVIEHVLDRVPPAGIDPKRQERPHAHSVDVSPDGRFVFVCDLGLDQVVIYRLDAERAALTPHGQVTLPAGSGPRHLAMHPSGRFAWCLNELSLTVTGFEYDAEDGALTTIETLSTLPDDVIDRHGFTCAEIAVHPSGRFLYASTRGHDSIAMYRIDEANGRLTFLGTEPTRAATPRHFAIAPGGTFLLAAGQTSHNVTVFAIDETTGKLTFTGHSVEIPSPVCILFGR